MFNLLDVDNNGDINEEEFIRLENPIATEKQKSKEQEFIRSNQIDKQMFEKGLRRNFKAHLRAFNIQ